VVVVEQDVLQRSFGGAAMTVAEATLIADAALEATVRTVLDALLASEILKSTRGVSPVLAGLLSCYSQCWLHGSRKAALDIPYVRSNTGCCFLAHELGSMMICRHA